MPSQTLTTERGCLGVVRDDGCAFSTSNAGPAAVPVPCAETICAAAWNCASAA